jgi:hypothetical protein
MYTKSVVRSKGLNEVQIGVGDKYTKFLETAISLLHVRNCVLLIDITAQITFQLLFNLRTYKYGSSLMQDMFLGLQESEKV